MFRKPSSRRKSESQEVQLNLVPMLDALVTLVSFLLMTMGYMAIAVIDTPAPMLAAPAEQIKEMKKEEPPLQLTLEIQAERILVHDWTGSRENHMIPSKDDPAKLGEKTYDLEALHQRLLDIKKRHPKERQLILKPEPGVPYDSLISIIDSGRFFEKTDTVPQEVLDEANKRMLEKKTTILEDKDLFPEIVFGNILST
ncbi:MAG: biopolymer transporter ExbD [Deltaproteobacteria bacterium]|nr:biopolymer transporter ExbD [Deltaproteobacteria bacterium]